MKERLLAIGFGFFVLLLIEGVFRLLDIPSSCDSDPYVSFSKKVPVLIRQKRAGEIWLELNPTLKGYFNYVAFPEIKSQETRRMFLLGGSVVLGFPFGEPGSFSRFLSLGLNQLGSEKWQIINLGGFGYASYRVVRVFKEVLNYNPDIIIVMSGHNEFLEKRVYGDVPKIYPGLIYAQEALNRLKIYCVLKKIFLKFRSSQKKPLISPEVKWENYTFEREQRERVISHYRFNLEEMVKEAKRKGVGLLFLTLPSNLSDFPPYHSEHNKGLSEEQLSSYDEKLDLAKQTMVEIGCNSEVFRILEELIKLDPDYAMAYYFLGRCYLHIGDQEKATGYFVSALSKDAWIVRALPEINNAIRETTKKYGIPLVDLEEIFFRQSKNKIPGNDLFYDHCHPRLSSQALIASSIIEVLLEEKKLSLSGDWRQKFQKICEDYIRNFNRSLLAEGYYRLGYELGINMELPDLGLPYAERAFELEPNQKRDLLLRRLKN